MEILKRKFETYLLSRAARILARSECVVVLVVGSVGKTSTKDASAAMLRAFGTVRVSPKSYNSDVGVALTILGMKTAWTNPLAWLHVGAIAWWKGMRSTLPERYLVLEVGADRPGDIARIVKSLRADVVVSTAWGITPVHMQFFDSPESLVREDIAILGALAQEGAIIADADDHWFGLVKDVATKHGARLLSYGRYATADSRIIDSDTVYDDAERPTGMRFDVECSGMRRDLRLHGAVGRHFGYPLAAAFCVAKALGLDLDVASRSIDGFAGPNGRMRVIDGVRGSVLIDDTYNSSPIAAEAAIDTLANLKVTGMRIAILGDMRELGVATDREHGRIGALCARKGINRLIAIGDNAQTLADAAIEVGMKPEAVSVFAHVDDALEQIANLPGEHDVVLLKGSQGVRIERATKALMERPAEAPSLLVRQDSAWNKR